MGSAMTGGPQTTQEEAADESSAACVAPGRPLVSDLASSTITSSQRWKHAYGEMLIETRANGTVWINGQLVRDTAPDARATDISAGPDAPR
jgi:hypothetical protein